MNLKPCPFCGGEAGWGAVEGNHYVQCLDVCPMRPTTSLMKYYDTKEEAYKAWNTRAALSMGE